MFKDTQQGIAFKKQMDKIYPRREVSREDLRELLRDLKLKDLLTLFIESNIDIIDSFLSKSNQEIDDSLFTFFHRHNIFPYKLKEE